MSTRADDRTVSQLRDVTIETGWSAHAEGSAIVSFGDTKVLCTASFTEGVPRWLKGYRRVCDAAPRHHGSQRTRIGTR